jgi:UDP-N-acetylglucosamine--N-acetylmuramyl-(pentapeptide) pyrophosphoryl-undecaprenol N-acetylglucosamine transferase
MVKAFYFVSPIGLGHATRGVAIASELASRGVEVIFASGANAADLISSYDFKVHKIISGPNPTESEGRMILPSLWYFRYWLAYKSNKGRVREIIMKEKPDIIIGDEEFSSISIAIEENLNHVMVSDELQLGFATSKLSSMIEEKVYKWYKQLQERTKLILVPDFGEDSGNIVHVTPAVRKVTRTKEEVRKSLNLPLACTLLTYSMSGSGLGKYFASRCIEAFHDSQLVDAHLALSGIKGLKIDDYKVHQLGMVRDNHELIASSDLVISSAGKSTIDEAMSYGTPIIAIPFKNHFEQEKNAISLGFSYEDIDRLPVLIQQHVGRRSEPRMYRGAEKASEIILSLL